ncbi:MAG: hypothetical protein JWM27_4926 [Gemmatimonadetes bacterium]|jgi:hypothetical protein|nr:hypothetical protein [Gemmatimonadota bacterium]
MSEEIVVPPPAIAELSRDPAQVPLAYGYLRVAPTPTHIHRVADSDWHRARVYACSSYHKAISRILRPEG